MFICASSAPDPCDTSPLLATSLKLGFQPLAPSERGCSNKVFLLVACTINYLFYNTVYFHHHIGVAYLWWDPHLYSCILLGILCMPLHTLATLVHLCGTPCPPCYSLPIIWILDQSSLNWKVSLNSVTTKSPSLPAVQNTINPYALLKTNWGNMTSMTKGAAQGCEVECQR